MAKIYKLVFIAAFLAALFSFNGICATAGAADQDGSGDSATAVMKKMAGKWLPYGMSMPGSPVALEITDDGFVKMRLLRAFPPFNEKAYEEWLFKKNSDTDATAKSPGGDVLKLALEKAGPEYFLQVTMNETMLFLYRPRGSENRTGFEGTWNMPAVQFMDFKEDGKVLFPSLRLPNYGGEGKFKVISGNRIAVQLPNKNGVETVVMILKPSDDFNTLKFDLSESAYKEAGPVYDIPPKDEFDADLLFLARGPSIDFFYRQPLIETQMKDILEAGPRAEYMNCMLFLDNLKSAEETYMADNGAYALTPALLDKYIGPCAEQEGCKGKTLEQANSSCAPGTLAIGAGNSGDSQTYKITVKATGDPGCNMCMTELTLFPNDFTGCPNEEINCGE
ncbi:MAG: hypothetical protein WCX65_03280 [bacterium]